MMLGEITACREQTTGYGTEKLWTAVISQFRLTTGPPTAYGPPQRLHMALQAVMMVLRNNKATLSANNNGTQIFSGYHHCKRYCKQ